MPWKLQTYLKFENVKPKANAISLLATPAMQADPCAWTTMPTALALELATMQKISLRNFCRGAVARHSPHKRDCTRPATQTGAASASCCLLLGAASCRCRPRTPPPVTHGRRHTARRSVVAHGHQNTQGGRHTAVHNPGRGTRPSNVAHGHPIRHTAIQSRPS